jgi:hypothetical protein
MNAAVLDLSRQFLSGCENRLIEALPHATGVTTVQRG